jgi:hypothetical protein
MDFTLSEEQEIFREELRKFLEAEIRPLDDRFGDEEMTAERAKELCRKLIPWGYLGGDTEALGVERDATIACIRTEELARTFPALAGISGMTAGAAAAIAAGAHPEVAARLVELPGGQPFRQMRICGEPHPVSHREVAAGPRRPRIADRRRPAEGPPPTKAHRYPSRLAVDPLLSSRCPRRSKAMISPLLKGGDHPWRLRLLYASGWRQRRPGKRA